MLGIRRLRWPSIEGGGVRDEKNPRGRLCHIRCDVRPMHDLAMVCVCDTARLQFCSNLIYSGLYVRLNIKLI